MRQDYTLWCKGLLILLACVFCFYAISELRVAADLSQCPLCRECDTQTFGSTVTPPPGVTASVSVECPPVVIKEVNCSGGFLSKLDLPSPVNKALAIMVLIALFNDLNFKLGELRLFWL